MVKDMNNNVMKQYLPKLATLAAALVLAGCSLAPTYKVPETATAATFKEAEAAATESAQWKTAAPAEGQQRGDWWKVFGDAELDRLIDAANAHNQDLAAAAARLKQARAFTGATEADMYPQLTAGFDPTRTQPSAASQGLPDGTRVPARTVYKARRGPVPYGPARAASRYGASLLRTAHARQRPRVAQRDDQVARGRAVAAAQALRSG